MWMNLLLVFVPIAVALEYLAPDRHLLIFIIASLAILPLAGRMGQATEQLAERMGEAVGGLLNATFGNAAELIIALAALCAGLHQVVEASIIGSIIGNMLLVFGAAMLAGGIRYPEQTFNPRGARSQATMLILSAIALILPAAFEAWSSILPSRSLFSSSRDRDESPQSKEIVAVAKHRLHMWCRRAAVTSLVPFALAGCESTGEPAAAVPTTYPGAQPSQFDRAFDAARSALLDQGLSIASEDRAAGLVVGTMASTTISISLRRQQDGTTRVQFSASDSRDPKLLDRVSSSYNRRMGR